MKSVFSPTFGFKPQYIISREKEISEYMESLSAAPGHPHRATFFIGQRGMGKTVLLLELAERAAEAGFIAVRVVAGAHMPDEIIEGIQLAGERYASKKKNPVKSVSAGAFGFSIGLTFTEEIQKNYGFRTKLTLLCEALMKQNKGLLFLIDEVYAGTPEIREFATAYQHLVGEGMNIAVAMAGLPNAISSVLNDSILTFLNRAYKVNLKPLPISDISACYSKALRSMDISFQAKTLENIAQATDGYPYLFQLIGFNMLKFIDGGNSLDDAAAELAITNSKQALVDDVFLPCLNPLSAEDRRFLKAMAADDLESSVSDIKERLQVSKSHIQTYRKRLIEAGVIHSPSRGVLAFSIPYLAKHLRGEL